MRRGEPIKSVAEENYYDNHHERFQKEEENAAVGMHIRRKENRRDCIFIGLQKSGKRGRIFGPITAGSGTGTTVITVSITLRSKVLPQITVLSGRTAL